LNQKTKEGEIMTATIKRGSIDDLVQFMQNVAGIKTKFVKRRRKIINSGSPVNAIDFKMRKKYNRPIVDAIGKEDGPFLVVGDSTHNHSKKTNKTRRKMAKRSRKINRGQK